MKMEHPLIRTVILKYVFSHFANKEIMFYWVPSHIGIRGNANADFATRSALELPRAKVGVPYINFKHHISQYILPSWQDDWKSTVASSRRLAVLLQAMQQG